jgi:hypothetical protein
LHAPKQALAIWRTGTISLSHPTAGPPEIGASTAMAAGYSATNTMKNDYHTSATKAGDLYIIPQTK